MRFQPDARCATIAPVPMLLQHQEVAINEPPSSGTNSAERAPPTHAASIASHQEHHLDLIDSDGAFTFPIGRRGHHPAAQLNDLIGPASQTNKILFKMLNSWLLNVRRKLHWTDYCMIVAICVTIAVFGFVEGVAAGMIATLAMFAIRLSRVDAIDEEFTGGERRSNKTRSIPDRAILLDQGETIRAYRLRGYIFFGSATPWSSASVNRWTVLRVRRAFCWISQRFQGATSPPSTSCARSSARWMHRERGW